MFASYFLCYSCLLMYSIQKKQAHKGLVLITQLPPANHCSQVPQDYQPEPL